MNQLNSLYDLIGGEDKLRALVDRFYDLMDSSPEAKNIRARWEELKSVTEGFVACCEEGNFAPLKASPPGATPSLR